MSQYNNALGYLIELRDEVNTSWFTKICDLAIDSDDASISPDELEKTITIFTEGSDYESEFNVNYVSGTPATTTVLNPISKLKKICNFRNFKKLSHDLEVSFDNRITIIFGSNGSGKSSICEAIKILGTSNIPNAPLNNLKENLNYDPTFSYKFDSDSNESVWVESEGFGLHSDRIKFFDSKIAVRLIQDPVNIEQNIEITPFKLHIFEYVRSYVKQFQNQIEILISHQNQLVLPQLDLIEEALINLEVSQNIFLVNLIKTGKIEDINNFLTQIKIEDYATKISQKANEIKEIHKLSTEAGVNTLKSEIRELNNWLKYTSQYNLLLKQLNLSEAKRLCEAKQRLTAEHEILLSKISGTSAQIEEFRLFLESSKDIFDYNNPASNCPFCRQELNEKSIEVIEQYKAFLFSKTEKELKKVNEDLNQILSKFSKFRVFDFEQIEQNIEVIPNKINNPVVELLTKIKSEIPKIESDFRNSTKSNYQIEVGEIENKISLVTEILNKKKSLLEISTTDKSKLDLQLSVLNLDLELLNKKKYVIQNESAIIQLTKDFLLVNQLRQKFKSVSFTGLYQKITNTAKHAHTDLIVSGFSDILNNEYESLTERSMTNLGVNLTNKGREASIMLNPTVGDNPIKIVLSEGELKIHALALFFCELSKSNEDIVVIDDPVTSLDYNYVANFVNRLRDYILSNEKQIILFTHDWAFFEQLRDQFNNANLNQDVKIMENCALCRGFLENLDHLKSEIEVYLVKHILTKSEKREVAGIMRVLIEAIVNERVFNKLKYRYKRAYFQLSNFKSLEKVVPLQGTEAQELKDLYKKLSPFEHDDETLWFTNTDVNQLQTRYDKIKQIEIGIKNRRP